MSAIPLSDKAKGKQRAIEQLASSQPGTSSTETPSKTLVIRFSEGIPDLTLQVAEKDTVRDVKRQIRDRRPQLKEHRLRLIQSGRLLTDGTFLYSWLASLEERQRRATADINTDGMEILQSNIWLHCSVGPKMDPDEEDETQVQKTQLKPLRGFDRLAAAGFSPEDIASIRSQFHSQSSRDFLDQEFSNDEDFDEHARALEEQWIDSMDSVASASQSSSNNNTMIMNGVLLGFFFPIIPFFFYHHYKPAVFWEEGPDHDVTQRSPLSKRIQFGIIIGLVMNFGFGVWTYALSD